MILGAGIGFKIAVASGGVVGAVLLNGAATGGSNETSLAAKPETITALCSYTPPSDHQQNTPPPTTSPQSAHTPASPTAEGQTLAALELDPRQQETARVIVQTAASDGMPKRAAVIGVATALQESDLGRDLVGDHGTSFGVFQQKVTSGYGTREQILDPRHAAHEFFVRLRDVRHWQSLPLTQAAQTVQSSGHPQAYAKHETHAEKIVDAFSTGQPGQPSSSEQADTRTADRPLTTDEANLIKSQVVVAAASGLSQQDATDKITQAITDSRSQETSSGGRPTAQQQDTRLQVRVAEQVHKAASALCTELTAAVSNLPGDLAGSARGVVAAQAAKKMVGIPYSWGGGGADGPSYGIAQGAGTKGFDCSGLAQYAWAKAGVHLGRTTGDQWGNGPKIPRSQLQPGDLLFFATNPRDPATIHHVGINVDGQRMIEAPQTGGRVEVSRWSGNPYREGQLIGAIRPAGPVPSR